MNHPSTYDAIALDCDGVLLDSNQLKIRAFRNVALNRGLTDAETKRFSDWQASNFGISRYTVLERLASGAFGKVTDTDISRMLREYALAIHDDYRNAPETRNLRELLEMLASWTQLYVVSGSDEAELRELFSSRGLSRYFRSVLGSPTTKIDHLNNIVDGVATGGRGRVLMVGDAQADFAAALASGAEFASVTGWSSTPQTMSALAARHLFRTAIDLEELFGDQIH